MSTLSNQMGKSASPSNMLTGSAGTPIRWYNSGYGAYIGKEEIDYQPNGFSIDEIFVKFLQYIDKHPNLSLEEKYLIMKTMHGFGDTELKELESERREKNRERIANEMTLQQEKEKKEKEEKRNIVKNEHINWQKKLQDDMIKHSYWDNVNVSQAINKTIICTDKNQPLTPPSLTSESSETSLTSFTSKLNTVMKNIKSGLGMK